MRQWATLDQAVITSRDGNGVTRDRRGAATTVQFGLWLIAQHARRPELMRARGSQSRSFVITETWLADKTNVAAADIPRVFAIVCAPVQTMKDLAADPSLRVSGARAEVPHKTRGTYLTMGSPIKFSYVKGAITALPPLGEPTDGVLGSPVTQRPDIGKLHPFSAV